MAAALLPLLRPLLALPRPAVSSVLFASLSNRPLTISPSWVDESCIAPNWNQLSHSLSTANFKMPQATHTKCRHPNEYFVKSANGEGEKHPRAPVPDLAVPWDVAMPDYSPTAFTAAFVLSAAWADPQLGADGFDPIWNSVDGKINRKSHEGDYGVSDDNAPLNIRGRTGLKGRGVLGKWGPNHAADPIVTRWKRDSGGEVVKDAESGKPILQFVSIQRRDTKEWAIPGGMVDPGEQVSVTVRREFMEEALDSTTASEDKKEEMEAMVDSFFKRGAEIYKGYVDDPRNTDNAWMETVAFLFHDDGGGEIGKFDLKAGDDAQALAWTDVGGDMRLYASHAEFVKKAAEKLGAHW